MNVNELVRRRNAWLAFSSSAISNYEALEDKYDDATKFVEETVHNCSVLADRMLVEYLKREKTKFELTDEEEDEVEAYDGPESVDDNAAAEEDEDDEDDEEEVDEEEEEVDEDELEEDEPVRRPAKKRARKR